MKAKFNLITWILMITFLASCRNEMPEKRFCENLGYEKAEVLFKALESYNNFLLKNFKSCKNQNQRIIEFLVYLQDHDYSPSENWVYNAESDKKIIDDFEKTGLRKDIWVYSCELRDLNEEKIKYYETQRKKDFNQETNLGELDYTLPEEDFPPIIRDSITIEQLKLDSIEHANARIASGLSSIIIALHKTNLKDSLILDYINAKFVAGDLTPELFIKGFLNNIENYNYDNVFAKIVIVTELYYGLIYTNIERRKASNIS